MMNLTRLRKIEFQNEVLLIMDGYEKIITGDQDVINIYLHYHPCEFYFSIMRIWSLILLCLLFGLLLGHVYELTCAFNYGFEHCMCIYGGYCRCGIADASGFSILHGRARTFHYSNAIDRKLFTVDIYNEFLKVKYLIDHSNLVFQAQTQKNVGGRLDH